MDTTRIGLPAIAAALAEPSREEAWNEHIARHNRRVVLTLVARGVPLELAKELAQEAWLKLILQHRAGKLEELRLPGLAIRQAQLLAKDHVRRRRRRQLPPRDNHDHDPEPKLHARAELRIIESVLAESSPRSRQIFALLYGTPPRSAGEAAAELNMSVQRVRQSMCELRQKIRSRMVKR